MSRFHTTWRWLGRTDGLGKAHLVECWEPGDGRVIALAPHNRYTTMCEKFGPGGAARLALETALEPCRPCFDAWDAAVSDLADEVSQDSYEI